MGIQVLRCCVVLCALWTQRNSGERVQGVAHGVACSVSAKEQRGMSTKSCTKDVRSSVCLGRDFHGAKPDLMPQQLTRCPKN